MNNETLLKAGLTGTVFTIIGLLAALTVSLGWSPLAITTALFIASYPLIWLAWRCYRLWCDSIMQLTSYSQLLLEGDSKIQFKQSEKNGLLGQLQQEIGKLGQKSTAQGYHHLTVNSVVSSIMDNWQLPVAIFNDRQQLVYRNNAIAHQLGQPMLGDTPAEKLGFTYTDGQYQHNQLGPDWQCQTMSYLDGGKQQMLFWAINIRQPLQRQQSHAQNNLVRVLGHEIRNSLTPIASMTDTLLCHDELPPAQTRQALERIHSRAERLLRFLQHYTQLNQLPPAQPIWFALSPLIEEAHTMVPQLKQLEVVGEQQVFGDPVLLSQVFINILKNACEASQSPDTAVTIRHYHRGHEQIIECADNGPGFANPDNVLTPFYTTKVDGNGIGLAMSSEILSRHNGKLDIGNGPDGAKITLSIPIPVNFTTNFAKKS